MTSRTGLWVTGLVLMSCYLYWTKGENCVQDQNCKLPDCFCPTMTHPLGSKNIPQIVYFGFDDAVQPQVSGYYDQLFTENRKNPNGCPITMSLYVSHQYTIYSTVAEYYKRGMEIGSHSVTHTDIDTPEKLTKEAKEQKENIEKLAGIPSKDVAGWRSPNLKTAGDAQPDILGQLGYMYDISLTYSKDLDYPFPFTLDYGYPYPCTIPPCPSQTSVHKGFWEIMVHSYEYNGLPCGYVDGCRPEGEEGALEYLWSNFLNTYERNRAPFGLNMHAAWFATQEYLAATERFIDRLLETPDVYIVNVRQMIEWMKSPVPISEINSFPPWGCEAATTKKTITSPTTVTTAGRLNPQPNPFLKWNLARQHRTNLTRTHPTEASNPTSKATAAPFRHRFWESIRETKDLGRNSCIQKTNCHLPECYCKTTSPPRNFPSQKVPQIIYLTIDTNIDGRTFAPLMRIFHESRRNPNGCQISGTVFIPSSGNYFPYVNALEESGIHIGIKGGTFNGHYEGIILRQKVQEEITKISILHGRKAGWRGLANLAPRDEVFQALQANNVTFDSSIITDSNEMEWPYTLDFGLKDRCAHMPSRCPTGRYPGLWEIPVNPLLLDSGATKCPFLDTCPYAVNSEGSIQRLLETNFFRHYFGNRAPFGVNLQNTWLTDSQYQPSMNGMLRFLESALRKEDVLVLSIDRMLNWLASPTTDIQQIPC